MNRVRLIDWLSRKYVWRYYQDYLTSQWYAPQDMQRLRVAKLRRLLQHCEKHVPFYRAIIAEQQIRVQDIDSLDVLKLFPVLDKASVRENYRDFLSTSVAGLGSLRYSQTGGTTGEPLRFPKDVWMRSSAQAAMLRFYDWMGVAMEDPKVLVWGAPIVDPGVAKRARDAILRQLTNTQQINPFGMTRDSVFKLAAWFRRQRPTLLHGYCLAIYELARWFEEEGLSFPLKAVSTTVEPLFEEYRVVLRGVFGCEAFDQYGCGEVEAIAMECASHEGLHVTEERVVLELDDQDRVIVTDLDNRVFPFIRYRNGDQARRSDRTCSCGRHSPLLRKVLGRTGDSVSGPSGRRVHPEFFTHLINETGISYRTRLRRYQVVQETPRRLVWRMAADQLCDSDRNWLIGQVQRYLGDVEVEIVQVDEIATSPSGKFQYVIAHH